MILDKENCFTFHPAHVTNPLPAQAVTASGASENVLNMGLGGIGKSQRGAPYLHVRCGKTFNKLTSLNIKLQTATDAAFTTPVDLPINITFPLAALLANTDLIRVMLPIGCLQFLRLYFTVDGTAPTQGTIEGYLVFDEQAGM
jgi:hypothetical protein